MRHKTVALSQPFEVTQPITFFAFEWNNPRLGKTIAEVRLKATSGFRGAPPGFTDDYGPVLTKNGVLLKAITVVRKRK